MRTDFQCIYRCVLSYCRVELLQQKEALARFLEELTSEIGMTMVSPPLVYEVASDKSANVGYSGCIIIRQSHLTFHTWPGEEEGRRIEIEINSCQEFERLRALEFACRFFEAASAKVTYLEEQSLTLPALAKSSHVRERETRDGG